MQYSVLGSSGLKVSRVCLGSMTWGAQNNQQEGEEQINYALANGVNFIDTAEMYAVPPRPETYGKTETIIGNWLAKNQERRKDIVLTSKIAGPGLDWIRNGGPITGEAIIKSVDASLQRLQTDYIDLYQLHWSNRPTAHFGKHWPNMLDFSGVDANKESNEMLEILQALHDCVQAGKIRYCGLSDDSTWSISQYLKFSEKYALPRITSIQNEFNLIHIKDWPYLIEHCVHENIAYLPWSPLAGGMLSGKYLNGARPEGSRWTISQRNGLFRDSEYSESAISQYVAIANKYDITPSQLALAWCNQVDGVTSTIIGATSLPQLKEDMDAFELVLSDDCLQDIMQVIKQNPSPF